MPLGRQRKRNRFRVCWFISLRRKQTAAAVPHKIFIRDTCFIIRIDPHSPPPLPPPPPPPPLLLAALVIDLQSDAERQSHKDKLSAGNELVLTRSKFPSLLSCSFMATVSCERLGERRLTYSRQMPDDSLGVKQSSGGPRRRRA